MAEKLYNESLHYDGRVAMRFYPQSHQYWCSVDGEKFERKRGVSGISGIKDKSIALGKWQQLITADFLLNLIETEKNIGHDEILEAVAQADIQKELAATTGTTAHKWCQAYIQHKLKLGPAPSEPEDKQIKQAVEAFLEWERANEVEYHASEQLVYSLKYDYVGTLDVDATVNGERSILDFKVSSGLYNSIRLQTMGYAMAAEEETGIPYTQRWGLRLNKLTPEEHQKKEDRKREIKKFIAQRQGKTPREYPNPPYQTFEAKLLAQTKKDHQLDKQAFLAALKLGEWDAETSFWGN